MLSVVPLFIVEPAPVVASRFIPVASRFIPVVSRFIPVELRFVRRVSFVMPPLFGIVEPEADGLFGIVEPEADGLFDIVEPVADGLFDGSGLLFGLTVPLVVGGAADGDWLLLGEPEAPPADPWAPARPVARARARAAAAAGIFWKEVMVCPDIDKGSGKRPSWSGNAALGVPDGDGLRISARD